jgi:dephospho-CoA kinase
MLGGIGAGKSHVAERIRALSATDVLDADALAQEALAAAARDGRLRAALGPDAVGPEGGPAREAIAARVFADPEARARLEAIIHPPVLAAIRARVAAHRRGVGPSLLVLDVPLLVETGLDRLCDVLVFVDAPEAERRRRAARRGWSAGDWERREAAQDSLARKRVRADAVIRSDERVDERLRPLLRDLGVLDPDAGVSRVEG